MAPSDADLQPTLGTSQSPPMLKASPSLSTTVIEEEEGFSSVISSCNATGYRANGTFGVAVGEDMLQEQYCISPEMNWELGES